MKKNYKYSSKRFCLFILLFLGINKLLLSQNAIPQGLFYETVLRDGFYMELPNQSVSFLFSIRKDSANGILVWEEIQNINTDSYGRATAIIGSGISTGLGVVPAFTFIDWSNAVYFVSVSVDITGGNSFVNLGTQRLYSVPYALYAHKTYLVSNLTFPKLVDTDTIGKDLNKMIKYDGVSWKPQKDLDADTVLYAFNSDNSLHSDTSNYAYSSNVSDTVLYSFVSGNSTFANGSNNSNNSIASIHSDTAIYALNSPPSGWQITGNAQNTPYFVGTQDLLDFKIKTNSTNLITLSDNGKFSIGTMLSTASMYSFVPDGVLSTGIFGGIYSAVQGAGAKLLWYPSKAAFRAGEVSSNFWDTTNVGNYSMSCGYNTKARIASFSSGFQSVALDYSIAMGRKAEANGVGPYPRGNVVAIGDSCIGYATRSVTLGRLNFADTTATSDGSTGVLIGYNNRNTGVVSVCLGSHCFNSGNRSVAIGYRVRVTHFGSFIFSDASSFNTTNSTANNQFLVRASGGVFFYTDPINTMGVALYPGSGSWASVSDRNKKENFIEVSHDEVLKEISRLKIKSWNYKSQSSQIIHVGPMAQDFNKQFRVGESKKEISTIDADGVILAGIKALYFKLNEVDMKLDYEKTKQNIGSSDNFEILNKRLDNIEQQIKERATK